MRSQFRGIKTKVLQMVLSLSMGGLVALACASITGSIVMRQAILSRGTILGETAARHSRAVMEKRIIEELGALAEDRAARTAGILAGVQRLTTLIANTSANILNRPQDFPVRSLKRIESDRVPIQTDPGAFSLPTPFLLIAPGIPVSAVQNEAARMANAGDLLCSILSINPHITSACLGMEAGYFLMADQTMGVTTEKDRDSSRATTLLSFTLRSARNFDHRTRRWYTGAQAAGGIFWTGPFNDALGRGAAISCSVPVYETRQGQRIFRGVAGCGIVLKDTVNRIIYTTRVQGSGYAIILDGNGTVIISPNAGDVVVMPDGRIEGKDYLHDPNAGFRELASRMIAGERGTLRFSDDDGVDRFVVYTPIGGTPWSFALLAPYAEISAPAEAAQRDMLASMLLALSETDHFLLFMVLASVGLILIATGLTFTVAARLANALTKPILELSQGARIIGAGNLDYRFTITSGDEVQELSDAFNRMIADIARITAEKERITAEKERINSQLAVAADIQKSVLPCVAPGFTGTAALELEARMESAQEVGGDFYDFFWIDDDGTSEPEMRKIALVIADVSGSGVPAALFMMVAKNLIKHQLCATGNPAAALEVVNRFLAADNPRCMFVTVFAGVLDLGSGVFAFANSGHPPPLLGQAGGPYRFMDLPPGMPLGIHETSVYTQQSLRLEAGDRLYLYTDGVNEAMNLANDLWGNDRLLAAANAAQDADPGAFDQAIRQAIRTFTGGALQSDDITSLAVRYRGREACRG